MDVISQDENTNTEVKEEPLAAATKAQVKEIPTADAEKKSHVTNTATADNSKNKAQENEKEMLKVETKEMRTMEKKEGPGKDSKEKKEGPGKDNKEKEQPSSLPTTTMTARATSMGENSLPPPPRNISNNEADAGWQPPLPEPIPRAIDSISQPGAHPVVGLNNHYPPNDTALRRPQPPRATTTTDMLVVDAPQAFLVDEDLERNQLKDEVRQEILRDAVEATQVATTSGIGTLNITTNNTPNTEEELKEKSTTKTKETSSPKVLVGLGFLLVVLVVVVVGLAVGLTRANNDDETSTTTINNNTNNDAGGGTLASANANHSSATWEDGLSTLERVQQRGFVKCGVFGKSHGFSLPSDDNDENEGTTYRGMNVEHCRAVAEAALGDPDKVEYVIVLSARDRFEFLQNYSLDMLACPTTHTMGRDVFERSAYPKDETGGAGFSFSVPFMYTGMAFGGLPEMVDCTEELDIFTGNCRDLTICVSPGTSHDFILSEELFGPTVKVFATRHNIEYFVNGTCNVLAKDQVSLSSQRMNQSGYSGPYKIGKRVFSREPLALATREDDYQWTNLVNSVVQLMYTAEAMNMTQEMAQEIIDSRGPVDEQEKGYTTDLYDRMLRITAAIGNYGEVYDREFEVYVPRGYPNLINRNFDTGLMYYFPFGNAEASSPGPVSGQMLDRILARGYLICGVFPKAGFAESDSSSNSTWFGFDVEFCKAVSAALFAGETETVEYVSIEGQGDRTAADLISGERMTLQKDLIESMTFSAATYYDTAGNAFALATGPGDSQWNDFVFWVVMAIIYAEDQGITRESLLAEPTLIASVLLFGESFKPMLYDCIVAVGNYGEIYNRTLEPLMPRTGGNMLNKDLNVPQQFALPLN